MGGLAPQNPGKGRKRVHSTFLVTHWRGILCCLAVPHVLGPLNVHLPHQPNSAFHSPLQPQVPPRY